MQARQGDSECDDRYDLQTVVRGILPHFARGGHGPRTPSRSVSTYSSRSIAFFFGFSARRCNICMSARRSRRWLVGNLGPSSRSGYTRSRCRKTTAARKRIGSLPGPRRMGPLASASASYTARAKTCGLSRAASCAIEHLFEMDNPPTHW